MQRTISIIPIWCFRFQTKETIVREQIRSTSDGAFDPILPFIDFIVCPAYHFAYKEDVLKYYGLDVNKYRNEGHFSPTINESIDLELENVFKNITHFPDEVLQKIKITTKDRNQRTFLQSFVELKNATNHVEIVTKYQSNLGRCYSIRPKSHVITLEIIKIDVIASMDIYVYIGYPGQFTYNTKERVLLHIDYTFKSK